MSEPSGNPFLTPNTSTPGYTLNIPVPNGNFALNLYNSEYELSGAVAGVSYKATGNIGEDSILPTGGTISAGPLSITLSQNGSDSMSLSNGIVTGTINFTNPTLDGATFTGINLTASTPAVPGVSVGASATVSLTNNDNLWQGNVSATVTVPGQAPISVYNNSFDPTKTDPCSLVPAAVQPVCSMIQSSAASGVTTINGNEQQQLKDIGITGDLVDPINISDDTLLADNDSSGLSYDTTNGLFGSTGIIGLTGITVPGGGGTSPASVHSNSHGYAAAVAKQSNKVTGANIAALSVPSKLPTADSASASASALADIIAKVTAGTGQEYWAVGSVDGETLVGSKGALIGINADLDAEAYTSTASGAGHSNAIFNTSGKVTSQTLSGTGETIAANNASAITVAASSSATINGTGNTIVVGSNSSIVLTGGSVSTTTDKSVTLGTGDTVTTTSQGLTLGASSTLKLVETTKGPTAVDYSVSCGSGDTLTVTATAITQVLGSSDTVTFTGTGNSIEAQGTSITIYANNSAINLYGSVQSIGTDKIVGTGNVITDYPSNGGGGGGKIVHDPMGAVSSSAASLRVVGTSNKVTYGQKGGGTQISRPPTSSSALMLVHAMAAYAPEPAADTDVSVRPEFLDRPSLAASSYLN